MISLILTPDDENLEGGKVKFNWEFSPFFLRNFEVSKKGFEEIIMTKKLDFMSDDN